MYFSSIPWSPILSPIFLKRFRNHHFFNTLKTSRKITKKTLVDHQQNSWKWKFWRGKRTINKLAPWEFHLVLIILARKIKTMVVLCLPSHVQEEEIREKYVFCMWWYKWGEFGRWVCEEWKIYETSVDQDTQVSWFPSQTIHLKGEKVSGGFCEIKWLFDVLCSLFCSR